MTPPKDVFGVLEAAAGRNALQMQPKAASITLWSFATLGRAPLRPVFEALEEQVRRVAADMDPQAVCGPAPSPARAGGRARSRARR